MGTIYTVMPNNSFNKVTVLPVQVSIVTEYQFNMNCNWLKSSKYPKLRLWYAYYAVYTCKYMIETYGTICG